MAIYFLYLWENIIRLKMYFNLKTSSFAPFYFKLERKLISILFRFRENKLSNQRRLKSASRKRGDQDQSRNQRIKAGTRESNLFLCHLSTISAHRRVFASPPELSSYCWAAWRCPGPPAPPGPWGCSSWFRTDSSSRCKSADRKDNVTRQLRWRRHNGAAAHSHSSVQSAVVPMSSASRPKRKSHRDPQRIA